MTISGIKMHLAKTARQTWEDWDAFWFKSQRLDQLRGFRFSLSVILFASVLGRTPDLEMFYSNHGIAPVAILPEIISPHLRISLLTLFPSDFSLWFFHIGLLVALFCLGFGIFPRIAAAIAFLIQVSFLHRNLAAVYGVDKIGVFFLFYLIMVQTIRSGPVSQLFTSMAFRLAQLQLCIIYAYSGLTKLRGAHWWQGDALWHVLANTQIARFDFTWTAQFPLAIGILSYLTVIWEVYFPLLIWTRARRVILVFGVLMHLGIAIAVNIPMFSGVMIASYFLFLSDFEMNWIHSLLNPTLGRFKIKCLKPEETRLGS